MNAGRLLIAATIGAGLLMGGCLQDGAQGPQGPAGEDGEDGESYVSYTNEVTGNVTTIAVQTGDNSPVEITINDASGDNSQAGTRRNPPAAEEPEPEAEGAAEIPLRLAQEHSPC